MEYNLSNRIAERKNKEVFRDGNKTIKLFVKNYSKADILNEALNQARVEESTDLYVPKLEAVTKINDRWAIVSEYAEGQSLAELIEQNPEKTDFYLNLFVDIQLTTLSKMVPLLTRLKEKFKRKLTSANLDENIKFELLQRLDGMENHAKLCHGDFVPSNIIIDGDGHYHVIDWSHATQGNASADAARTYLVLMMNGQADFAEKYLDLFVAKSEIAKSHIQRWIPIVAATQLTKCVPEEKEFLEKWIDVVEY